MRGVVGLAASAGRVPSRRCQGPSRGYISSRRVHECARCAYRTPLTSWFWAINRMSHDKKGISAVQSSKEIGVCYQTAWLLQHKIRKAMADRNRSYTLGGIVEVYEDYVGGVEEGGRRGPGGKDKAVVAVAVEPSRRGSAGQAAGAGF